MSTATESGGTRFLLHCQPDFIPGFEKPVIHTLNNPPGSVKAGPMDDRIKIVDALNKPLYDDNTLPPYKGTVAAPAEPNSSGHFDQFQRGTREFRAAHAFAGMRMVLDVWEKYSAEPVRWFFGDEYQRLEVIPYVDWENGQAGYGFVELGYGMGDDAKRQPFSLNFDVLAHEMGHVILVSEIGMPFDSGPTQYRGFQEAASDIISLISVLHFEPFRKHLLDQTHGNLYVRNELNSLAEVSPTKQIRSASHSDKMSDIDFATISDRYLSQEQIHELGQPFTAAIFDILVEVFHEELVENGSITRALDDLAEANLTDESTLQNIDDEFVSAYRKSPEGFMKALEFTRDFMGERLIPSWKRLDPDELTLWNASVSFMTVDRELSGAKYQEIVRDCFRWRQFEP